MKNIHLISTDNPSRLYLHSNNELQLRTNIIRTSEDYLGTNQNIYITSDEEITGFENNIWVIKGERIFLWQNTMALVSNNKPKKIILTTDHQLIEDGVQEIDDEFLEWFVKNPSCEFVDVQKWASLAECGYSYHIIIPQEPKPIHQQIIDIVGGEDRFKEIAGIKPKQETLEEAANKFASQTKPENSFEEGLCVGKALGFIEGAKWQAERMFSDEEVIDLLAKFRRENRGKDSIPFKDIQEWFEQFKKK